jgi:hypothetical protein
MVVWLCEFRHNIMVTGVTGQRSCLLHGGQEAESQERTGDLIHTDSIS